MGDAVRTLEVLLETVEDAQEDMLKAEVVVLHSVVITLITRPPFSRPGEPPGLRTGSLRRSYQFEVARDARGRLHGAVFSSSATLTPEGKRVIYAPFLELGTSRMEPRPHVAPAVRLAAQRMARAAGKALEMRQRARFQGGRL